MHSVHQVGPGRQGGVIDFEPKTGARQAAMPESAAKLTPKEEPKLAEGEIVGIEATRIRVRLDSGTIGFMPLGERQGHDGIEVGTHASFRIVAIDPGGSPSLTLAEEDTTVAKEPFDREVDELHHALANHQPANSVRSVERVHLGEEQIRSWIGRVEGSLVRLRKNRTKRQNEEFYTGP